MELQAVGFSQVGTETTESSETETAFYLKLKAYCDNAVKKDPAPRSGAWWWSDELPLNDRLNFAMRIHDCAWWPKAIPPASFTKHRIILSLYQAANDISYHVTHPSGWRWVEKWPG